MSVAVSDVRFVIQDQPRSYGGASGSAGESPRYMGAGDNNNTTFYLPLDGTLQFVLGSEVIYMMALGGAPVSVAKSAYTISQQGLVMFNTPPAGGTILTVSFQATVFADADLATVLADNVTTYGDDRYVKWGCQLDIIDILLTNPAKLARLREAEYEKDPTAVLRGLKDWRDSMQRKIESGIRPGRSAPVLMVAGPTIRNYQPGR
jgi:hypothetical protein